ncbi:MAG: NADPH-dependent glutamate synthase [Clostridium sp.]|nr:NADPH-dependent glutamate synthase [Clostridium sp.]
MNRMKRVPVREQGISERIKNFNEVSLGYNEEEAIEEANRCLQCKKPGCIGKCPVHNNIPGFIKEIREKNYKEAGRILSKTTTLPAVCGRVCPQELQCEGGCVLGIKGEPIAIGKLERFIGDWCREKNVNFNEEIKLNGKKVAVVGSGPAGIACAGDLAKMGYSVTIFELLQEPGGILSWGIPEFVLPKKTVVRHEVENVINLGVKIETGVTIGKTITVDKLLTEKGFKAVFIANGADVPRFMGIKGENLNGVMSANEVLTKSNIMKGYIKGNKTTFVMGKKVAVVGGGNVAIDAVRTALRLGADTHLIYRRSESEIPARKEEVGFAKSEGVKFHLLTNPVEILGDKDGRVSGIRCIKMKLGEPDESGRRRPIPIEGSEYDVDVDMVIMAIGSSAADVITDTTSNLNCDKKNRIIVSENSTRTSKKGVYAGGDAVTGPATVILAMSAGKKAALEIDEDLK